MYLYKKKLGKTCFELDIVYEDLTLLLIRYYATKQLKLLAIYNMEDVEEEYLQLFTILLVKHGQLKVFLIYLINK